MQRLTTRSRVASFADPPGRPPGTSGQKSPYLQLSKMVDAPGAVSGGRNTPSLSSSRVRASRGPRPREAPAAPPRRQGAAPADNGGAQPLALAVASAPGHAAPAGNGQARAGRASAARRLAPPLCPLGNRARSCAPPSWVPAPPAFSALGPAAMAGASIWSHVRAPWYLPAARRQQLRPRRGRRVGPGRLQQRAGRASDPGEQSRVRARWQSRPCCRQPRSPSRHAGNRATVVSIWGRVRTPWALLAAGRRPSEPTRVPCRRRFGDRPGWPSKGRAAPSGPAAGRRFDREPRPAQPP